MTASGESRRTADSSPTARSPSQARKKLACCSCPPLKGAQVLQLQVIELDGLAQVQHWLFIAVIEGRKIPGLVAQVHEQRIFLVPVLKRKFAFHSAIVRLGDTRNRVGGAVPTELSAYAGLSAIRQLLERRGESHRIQALGVGKPC